MWFVVLLLGCLFLILTDYFLHRQINIKIEKYVIENSRVCADIKKINSKYNFNYTINSKYTFSDSYKSKRSYDNYNYDLKFKECVKDSPSFFEQLLEETQNNAYFWEKYLEEYEKIDSFFKKEDVSNTIFPLKSLLKKEKEMYHSLQLHKPTTHLHIVLIASYTSPAGYSHYESQRLFGSADVRAVLDEICLKKDTKKESFSKVSKETCEEKKQSANKPEKEVVLSEQIKASGVENNCDKKEIQLSKEQEIFISEAKEGKNILVDACIGSGKTTAIQKLCERLDSSKKILYLTYNTLLKLDAKKQIKCKNATVTNYHGFAYGILTRDHIPAGRADSIQQFNLCKPMVPQFDVLILDEYQDIDREIADMLELIKAQNPQMQLIAVGDMDQKIYDKTTLDIKAFIGQFLGEHINLFFTNCFRLPPEFAKCLGDVWNKRIVGVNNNCVIEEMNACQVIDFLSFQDPKDVLCLGRREGALTTTLNSLELKFPLKYNKKTVYASIRDTDSLKSSSIGNNCAIFTTYDSCKGLERKICVVFDYTEKYWFARMSQASSYTILRNIFCVAASRGKKHIIFVKSDAPRLSFETLKTAIAPTTQFRSVSISTMFDFKYSEDIEECFRQLKINSLTPTSHSFPINVKGNDERIDLSPCIGIYQEAVFFKNYNIEKDIALQWFYSNPYGRELTENFASLQGMTLEDKILYLVSLETKQNRYRTQVSTPFITQEQSQQIMDRLSKQFQREENIQVGCSIPFSDKEDGTQCFSANGYIDVLKDGVVYELKFVTELQKVHFLQCACYVVATGVEKGVLWNVQNDSMYEITVPDKKSFLNAVVKTITRGKISCYYKPIKEQRTNFDDIDEWFLFRHKVNSPSRRLSLNLPLSSSNFVFRLEYTATEEDISAPKIAVIDTETNFDGKVMSIGVVVASAKSFHPIAHRYYIVDPEYIQGGMYANGSALLVSGKHIKGARGEVIEDIRRLLDGYNVSSLFAYGAFDYNHLNELSDFCWYDIIKVAAYKQYNHKIPENAELCNTGRLKRNYKVSDIYKMLTDNLSYEEKHHALQDAFDELKILELLGLDIEKYEVAILNSGQLKGV